MISTSELNSSIVFSLAIFWDPGPRDEDKGRGPRVEEHKHPNITHPIFQKLYHTNVCTSSLYEFAILHGQTS